MFRRQKRRGFGQDGGFICQSRAHAISHSEKRQITRRAPRPARGPGGIAAQHAGKGIGGGKRTQGALGKPGAPGQILHSHEGCAIAGGAGGEQRLGVPLRQACHKAEPKPQRQAARAFWRFFQAAIPIAGIHIHRAHYYAVVPRIAHDLRWRVKPHGLAVQQRTGKGRRVMAFQPGRGIDQMREARRMAFGKTITAKAFDLRKDTLRQILRIAAPRHARHQLFLMARHQTLLAKGCHGAAQLIRFFRREAGGDNSQAHRLFLKQRHAKRAPQHLLQFIRRAKGGIRCWVFHRFQPLTPTQIGMHHIALNGARAHNRHLHHQIIKGARFQPRQHIHLRAAFHLKHANGIRTPQHGIGFSTIARQVFQGEGQAPMLCQ